MTPKSKQMCDQIRKKLISKITGESEFKNNDAVMDATIINFYNKLKKERYI